MLNGSPTPLLLLLPPLTAVAASSSNRQTTQTVSASASTFYLARRKINLSAVCTAHPLKHTHTHTHTTTTTNYYYNKLQLQQATTRTTTSERAGELQRVACGFNAATSCKMFAIFRQHQVAVFPPPPFVRPVEKPFMYHALFTS